MSKKIDRATHGPSLVEVVLGAVISAVLGVVIGAALLIIRPVVTVKELPKEPAASTVYYIEGSRDTSKARQAVAKRNALVQGQSITVTEDEINSLMAAPPPPPPPAKKGENPPAAKKDEKAAPPPAASGDMLAVGSPNFRIRDNALQVAVPVTLNVAGVAQRLIVQARGGFTKGDGGFVYDPETLYFGSCPVQRLPFVSGYVRKTFLAAQPIPEDIATAWGKLANVAVEGSTLKLTMP